ncbi:MAG TPA: 3-hydroxyacyl-CoA dehydrogenase NAD-binding domain-containing protein [Stellaceae bacterium]
MTDIAYSVDGDGVATIVWDMPGRTMNVLNAESVAEYEAAVDRAIGDAAVKGVIVTSGKPSFIAGADLPWLEQLTQRGAGETEAAHAKRLYDNLMRSQLLFRRIEKSGKPFVAAINGTAAGGGFEVCLACHHRIAADDPRMQIGLPESKVGLLPGGGGVTHLVRMLGAMKALPLLLEGRMLSPAKALEAKLIDAVVPAGELLARAKAWILAATPEQLVKPWDKPGFVPPGADPRKHADGGQWSAAITMLHKKTRGNYPALQAIEEAAYDTWLVPMDTAIKIETRYLVKLMLGANARNMIRTNFVNMQRANKLARRPATVPARAIKRVGVLGAGLMGAGIAHVAARAGIEVVLIDRDQATADKGRQHTADTDPASAARITPTADFAALKGVDLVIEAVFEDRAVKADATKRALAVVGVDTIFASNTSTLPITGLAENWPKPDNFIGLHFFSPVEKMQLVEIIMGKKTGDTALALAMDFVKAIRKTPIVVNDSRGFYTSRVFATYTNEALRLLVEGVKPALIENAGKAIGMPMPPLALCDEVALDLILRVAEATKADLGDKYETPPYEALMNKMVKGLGRLGKKARKGFYEYPSDGPKRLWPGLGDLAPVAAAQPSYDEVKTRLLIAQAIEAARCFAEGVVTDPADADIGAVLGWGFAPWTGGPLSHIDTMGADKFVALCDELAQRHGPRFAPNQFLRDLAATNGSFYPDRRAAA